MSDFLDQARNLQESGAIKNSPADLAFTDVFNAMGELRFVYDKSHLETDNIETLFGTIEMGVLINKFGQRKEQEILNLRSSIITLIVSTLELSIKFPVREDHIYPSPPYDKFVEMINKLRQNPSTENMTFSFITFNYDLALDYALRHQASIPWDYCLSDKPKSHKYPYLKLHGSINWGVCQKCKTIVPNEYGPYPSAENHVFWDAGSRINEHEHCEKPLGGPLIVPPTWNKTDHPHNLINVWRRASEELGTANNIFIIGYSMPETDSFFRYLFALGSESATRLQRFWVFNPDEGGSVEERFDKLIGAGIRKRYRFFNEDRGGVQSAIIAIGNELG